MIENTTNTNSNRQLPIKVLIVEDSISNQEFLVYLFASDQEFKVIGTANNGEEALAAVETKKPDVITMDIHMPKMDGYTATRAIMENYPTPIVIVTGSKSVEEITTTMKALEAGALAVVKRPSGIGHPDHSATARELIQTVKLMSEVKVIRRWAKQKSSCQNSTKPVLPETKPVRKNIRLITIGSSTGGPLALQQLLSKLPNNFHIPIVIVQHIAQGFTEGFVKWLEESSGYPVSLAANNEQVHPGRAYVAPNGFQITINKQGRIELHHGGPENGHLPSVSYLFRTVSTAYGPNAVGILLTGMGKDGAEELGMMRAKGATTFAQDRESAVIYGMPGEAIERGGATYILPPDKISAALINL